METLTVDTDTTPLQYQHPFLISQHPSQSLHIWSFATDPPSLYTDLEGTITNPSCHLLSPTRLVTFDQVDLANSVILVHALPEGTLLDHKSLDAQQPRTYGDDGEAAPLPAPGECTPLVVSNRRIAVWRNGTDGHRGAVDVYEVSSAGTLAPVRHLHMPQDAPALAVRNIGYEYLLPEPVHLTEEYFLGAVVLHPSPSVHLIRWSSADSPDFPSHVELPFTREEDAGITLSAALNAHLFIPPSNQLILAYYECPLDCVDERPVTNIRSINPDTLSVEWCTSIEQQVNSLHHHAASDSLVAIGWASEPHGVCVTVLDARTGEVRRTDTVGDRALYNSGAIPSLASGVHCSMTPSGNEIVVVFGDGQVAVSPLSEFVARGFVKAEGALVTMPSPLLEATVPRNAKERRRAAAGNWVWVERVFVGEGKVIVKPERGGGFVVMRWR